MKNAFRTIGLALLGSLIFGLVVGTLINAQAQKPVIYIGKLDSIEIFDQEFLREVQVRSLTAECLFSTRASTNKRSDNRFT